MFPKEDTVRQINFIQSTYEMNIRDMNDVCQNCLCSVDPGKGLDFPALFSTLIGYFFKNN